MRLMDNGVSQNMSLDYGDYTIMARLDHIEPLQKPTAANQGVFARPHFSPRPLPGERAG